MNLKSINWIIKSGVALLVVLGATGCGNSSASTDPNAGAPKDKVNHPGKQPGPGTPARAPGAPSSGMNGFNRPPGQ